MFGLILQRCKSIQNNERGRRIKGGSTLSQQTAKILWQGRSYFRKGLEAILTVLINSFGVKNASWSVYLNSIEMGSGGQAAAEHWYRRCCNLSIRLNYRHFVEP
jgi:monofunctional biosynthetic peptidoglycan transglycosylase